MNLLFSEIVSDIYLNDIDVAIYSFWHYCISDPEEFCDRIGNARFTTSEWDRHRGILRTLAVSVHRTGLLERSV